MADLTDMTLENLKL